MLFIGSSCITYENSIVHYDVMLQDGKVSAYRKSEPIPESNDEPVKVVVADTLQEMVFNSGKNGKNVYLLFLPLFTLPS